MGPKPFSRTRVRTGSRAHITHKHESCGQRRHAARCCRLEKPWHCVVGEGRTLALHPLVLLGFVGAALGAPGGLVHDELAGAQDV